MKNVAASPPRQNSMDSGSRFRLDLAAAARSHSELQSESNSSKQHTQLHSIDAADALPTAAIPATRTRHATISVCAAAARSPIRQYTPGRESEERCCCCCAPTSLFDELFPEENEDFKAGRREEDSRQAACV